ncbi:MAG: ATP-binding protein [Gaiellaceae bacterium]
MNPAAASELTDGLGRFPLLRRFAPFAVALGAPGLVTLLAFTDVAPVLPALLYVAAISLAALAGGVAAGLLAALASFGPFTYFFTPPLHTFAIGDAADGGAVAVFVVVAVGTSQLVARERLMRARAESAAAQTRRLEAVANALGRAETPDDVLETVLTEGLSAAEARAGAIGVLSNDGTTIEVAAHRGYAAGDRFVRWGRFGVDEQVPLAEAVRTSVPVYVSTTAERDRRFPPLAGLTESTHALACLPLVFEGRTIGGLALGFPTEQDFDAERRALEDALAAQTAQALERVRLRSVERELRERLVFLAEASELLASSLDYERTLRRLADLVVPRLADWCTIDMLAEDGSIERLAVAHQDPAKVRYVEELAKRYPSDPEATSGVPQVLRSGEPELIPYVTEELLVEAVKGDDELARIVRELELRSAITVPLIARGRTLGALALVAAETVRPYTQADVELAQDLARRAAVAVDNARLHEEAERRADAARALHYVADAVVLVDRLGRPRYWNESAESLLGGRDGALSGWREAEDALRGRGWAHAGRLTLPLELAGDERWVQVARAEFDDGHVYVLRDVTEAQVLERTRSDFVATASHELRTPIAAVYGVFQTLLRRDVSLEAGLRDQFLQTGLQESERLARIVDDLLITGELESGSPRIAPARCDLASLIGEVVDAARERMDERHTLVTFVDSSLEPLQCDPLRLRQVLANLVENALKYSPDGGTVSASARALRGAVAIEVSDEGIGIPAHERSRIFDRFVRLDPALSRGVGGTGLGLYICRGLVERMGGTIDVRSGECGGSVFTVELPARSRAVAPAIARDAVR